MVAGNRRWHALTRTTAQSVGGWLCGPEACKLLAYGPV